MNYLNDISREVDAPTVWLSPPVASDPTFLVAITNRKNEHDGCVVYVPGQIGDVVGINKTNDQFDGGLLSFKNFKKYLTMLHPTPWIIGTARYMRQIEKRWSYKTSKKHYNFFNFITFVSIVSSVDAEAVQGTYLLGEHFILGNINVSPTAFLHMEEN